MLFSETWTSRRNAINLDIQGYDCVHIYGQKSPNVRKGRQSGGISVYYKHELKEYISIVEQNKNGIMWLKIKNEILFSNEDIYICHSYIPPASSKVLFDQQFDFFEEIEKGIEKHSVVNLAKIDRSLRFKLRKRLAGCASRTEDRFKCSEPRPLFILLQ